MNEPFGNILNGEATEQRRMLAWPEAEVEHCRPQEPRHAPSETRKRVHASVTRKQSARGKDKEEQVQTPRRSISESGRGTPRQGHAEIRAETESSLAA